MRRKKKTITKTITIRITCILIIYKTIKDYCKTKINQDKKGYIQNSCIPYNFYNFKFS